MAWFKADDRICEHPKFIAARARGGHGAIGVWFHAGTWSNANLTDGFIPETWVMLNGAENEARILVDVGLWHESAEADGFQMHDYGDFQPLRADVEAKREKELERKRRGGSARNPRGNRAEDGSPVPGPVPVTTPNGVVSAPRVSAKEARTRKRLGLVADEGGAA